MGSVALVGVAMTRNIIVYVVTRFASRANRRNMQFLKLRDVFQNVFLVHQSHGGDYTDDNCVAVNQFPRFTGVLGLLGLKKLEGLVEQHLYSPSPGILYTKPAQRKLDHKLENDLDRGRNVCVITALPPHELVVVGLYLKKRFPQIRWIVDWQDLWTYDENYIAKVPEARQGQVRALEKRVFDSCDMNVVTNPFAASILEQHYGIDPGKVRAIYHAYERNEIEARDRNEPRVLQEPIEIGFLGNLFKPPKVPGRKVLDALGHVRRSGVDLSLRIIGDKYLEKVSRAPIDGLDWVTAKERMDHVASLQEISGCDFLLLALEDLPNSRVILHMKLPFYLALQRPILAIVPRDSAVASVIKETGTGYVIPSSADWGHCLKRVLRTCIDNGIQLNRNEEAIARFSWAEVSQQWLQVIRGDSFE